MNKGVLLGGVLGVAVALVAGVALVTKPTAASVEYVFWARGDVVQVDTANKTVTVYSRHNSSTGEHDLAGQTVEFNVKDALFYKYDSKLRKVRTTLGSLAEGDEVVLNGTKKTGDIYTVSRVTENYHTIKVKGTVEGHDVANRVLTVQLNKAIRVADKKEYRKTEFVPGTDIKVYYGSGTKVVNQAGNSMNADEIANDREKVTIENLVVKFGSRFEAGPDSKIVDGKYTF